MKNTIKLISSLVLTLALLCSMTVTAFADTARVTYEGDAGEFIFEPGSDYSPTDLFTNYKGVMPGDQITQVINVKNDASKKVDVEIFIKAIGPIDITDPDTMETVTAEQSADFLKEMNMTVTTSRGDELFDAPVDQTTGLDDWGSLGKFRSGADVDLNVVLNVPITMGNDCQDRIGALGWTFKVVEKPVPTKPTGETGTTEKDKKVKTGDDMNLFAVGGICIAAAVLALIVLLSRKQKRS